MNKIEHKITLHYQTPEVMCGPTALAMQLSVFGYELSPHDIFIRAQTYRRPGDFAFLSQELATLCLDMGLRVEFYSFDGRVLDYSWTGMDNKRLEVEIERFCQPCRVETPLNDNRLRYALSYLTFIKAGGTLRVEPYVRTKLLLELLERGPVGAAVAFNVFASDGKRDSSHHLDPVRGGFGTHSVVIYGYDERLGFLVADPTPGRGRVTLSPENLLAAITAAQVEDDNAVFLITQP